MVYIVFTIKVERIKFKLNSYKNIRKYQNPKQLQTKGNFHYIIVLPLLLFSIKIYFNVFQNRVRSILITIHTYNVTNRR